MKFAASLALSLLASIPMLVGVAFANVTVTPADLSAHVSNTLLQQQQAPSAEAHWVIEVLNLPHDSITLKGDTLQVFVNDTRSNPYTSRGIVQVTLSTEAETRQVGVPIRISLEQPVWVASRLIRAKELLTPNDFRKQIKRLDTNAAWAIPCETSPAGYSARINIMPGTVLDNRQVNITPSVVQNDEVRVVLKMASGVQLTILGKALENGVIGQTIKVRRTLDNRKARILTGQVIGKNQVLVEM